MSCNKYIVEYIEVQLATFMTFRCRIISMLVSFMVCNNHILIVILYVTSLSCIGQVCGGNRRPPAVAEPLRSGGRPPNLHTVRFHSAYLPACQCPPHARVFDLNQNVEFNTARVEKVLMRGVSAALRMAAVS